MALDAVTLALAADELRGALDGARIDKIHQPTRDEVLFVLRRQDEAGRYESLRLLVSARSGSARVCLTGESYENPAVPPSFCMLLRKHLTGGRLVGLRTVPGDRIVFFDFLCTNEMGDLVNNTLAAELMGRYCNLVLVRDAFGENAETPKIMDALKRVDFEASEVRQLLPGLAYTLPPAPKGLDFIAAPAKQVLDALRQSGGPVPTALRKAVSGVGPALIREVCFRAFGAEDPAVEALSGAQWQALEQALAGLRAEYAAGGRSCMVKAADGRPVEFSFTRLTQYLPECTLVEYPREGQRGGPCAYSDMLEDYYAEKDRGERMRQKSKQLHKAVQNMLERAVRKQAARQEDLAAAGKSGHLREYGELLTANLHAFQKGDAAVAVENWYTGEKISIPLDARLSPSQNAQRYFKEYKKKQTAAVMLEKLLKSGETEIEYLKTVLYEVENAQGEAALGEVRAELKGQGYLKYYKQRDKRQKPADFLRYTSADGFEILVGRNNAQNEKLTLKTARGKDLWFHVKNAPGSHVVVMSRGEDIPLATQNQAAMLAVWHSSQKNGVKVPVDYTQVKNIRKTGDLPPGMVLYEHYETAYVTAEEGALPEGG